MRADNGQLIVARLEELPRHPLQRGRVDGRHLFDDLFHAERLAGQRLLPAKPARDGHGVLQAQQQPPRDEFLGAVQGRLVHHLIAQPLELGQNGAQRLQRAIGGYGRVDAGDAGVSQLADVGIDGIGQPQSLANLQKEAGAHAFAQNDVQQVQREAVAMIARQARQVQRQVGLLHLLVDQGHLRPCVVAWRGHVAGRGRALPIAQQAVSQLYHLAMVHGAGHADHRVERAIVAQQELAQAFPALTLDAVGRAGHIPAQGMVRPGHLVQRQADQLLRDILRRADLFQNDPAFLFHLIRDQQAVAQHVRQHIQRQRQMGLLHLGPEHRHLLPGAGIEQPAVSFDLQRDGLRSRPALGALEQHVLDEVSGAGRGRLLVAGADGNVEPHTYRISVGQGGAQHAQPVSQGGFVVGQFQ
jgi:hypothetical protein